ncbi:hypothetical protein ACIG5E_04590 [Kitasatospora sp. NPDC053057]|uniref:hypothetical protein n=1 Tax=Kitasatospora sp. NPDC053057 TaxID=3364062 RepID=UPI0037C5D364
MYDPMDETSLWRGAGAGFLGIPTAEGSWDDGQSGPIHAWGSLDDLNLLDLNLLDTVPHQATREPERAIRHRREHPVTSWPSVFRKLFGVLTAVTVTAVCVLDWLLCYSPLCDLAGSRVPHGMNHLWPVIIYGPWLVGSLSTLRSTLESRRLVHAWVVVVVFSGIATGLCSFEVYRTSLDPLDIIVAGLPPITSAVCLHQLVRQLAAASRPSRPSPRHTDHRVSRRRRR